jgi:hypothetical protein
VDQLNLLRSINTRLTDENDLRSYTSAPSNSLNETKSLAHEMEQMLVDRDVFEEEEEDDMTVDPGMTLLQFNFMQKKEVEKTKVFNVLFNHRPHFGYFFIQNGNMLR